MCISAGGILRPFCTLSASTWVYASPTARWRCSENTKINRLFIHTFSCIFVILISTSHFVELSALLRGKSSALLPPSSTPSSTPSLSIAYRPTFCLFFSDKISFLGFTLLSLLDSHSSNTDPSPNPTYAFQPVTYPYKVRAHLLWKC